MLKYINKKWNDKRTPDYELNYDLDATQHGGVYRKDYNDWVKTKLKKDLNIKEHRSIYNAKTSN